MHGPGTAGRVPWPTAGTVIALCFALVTVLLVGCSSSSRDFTYTVPSDAMAPALENADVVSGTTHFKRPQRGDIVVFAAPPGASISSVPDLIKRVVGLPGETIQGRAGIIQVDEKDLSEPYLGGDVRSRDFPAEKIPPDHYWVLGDNRQDSRDSTFFKSIAATTIKAVITHTDSPPSRRGAIPHPK
jgi:signal peptidase I